MPDRILREYIIVEPVQNLAALTGLNTTTYVGDAIVAFVRDAKASYVLDLTSTQAADGVNVIQPTTGSGRWFRLVSRFEDFSVTGNGGVADAYTASFDERLTAYEDGQRVYFKPDVVNTGASTLNINGAGVKKILHPDGSEVDASELPLSTYVHMIYNSDADGGAGAFEMVTQPLLRSRTYITQTASDVLSNDQPLSARHTGLLRNTTGTGVLVDAIAHTDFSPEELITAGGAADAYTAAIDAGVVAYAAGLEIYFTTTNANTGASTLDVNGIGAQSIVLINGDPLGAGDIVNGGIAHVKYDGTNFQLLNPQVSAPASSSENELFIQAGVAEVPGKVYNTYANALVYINANGGSSFFNRWTCTVVGQVTENVAMQAFVYLSGKNNSGVLVGSITASANTNAQAHIIDGLQFDSAIPGGVNSVIECRACQIVSQDNSAAAGTIWCRFGTYMNKDAGNPDIDFTTLTLEVTDGAQIFDMGDFFRINVRTGGYVTFAGAATGGTLNLYDGAATVIMQDNTTISLTTGLYCYMGNLYSSGYGFGTNGIISVAGGATNDIINATSYGVNLVASGAGTTLYVCGYWRGQTRTETITTAAGGAITYEGTYMGPQTGNVITGDDTISNILDLDTGLGPALITGKPAATVASGDLFLMSDIDDANNLKQVTAQAIADLQSTSYTRVRYVDLTGNDATGDGTLQKPFLTVQAAIDDITANSAGRNGRAVVLIGPGLHDDPIVLKRGIVLAGLPIQQVVTTIRGDITVLSEASATRIGLESLSFTANPGPMNLTLNIGAAPSARAYIHNCEFDDVAFTNTGFETTFVACQFNNGSALSNAGVSSVVNIQSSLAEGSDFTTTNGTFKFIGGQLLGGTTSLLSSATGVISPNQCTAAIDNVTGSTLNANAIALSGGTITNSATLVRLEDIEHINYDNSTSGLAADNGQAAIDELASEKSNGSTGIVSGGELSINGGNPAQFDVSAGSGVIVDDSDPENPVVTNVTIAASTGNAVTNIATSTITYVLVNSAGTLVQQTTPPTLKQFRTAVSLGILSHPDNANISVTNNLLNPRPGQSLQTYDLMSTLGPIKRSGHAISANGANLRFDRAAGESLLIGRNFYTDPELPNITTDASDTEVDFVYAYQDGGGGVTLVTGQTDIDPAQYDDGSGTLQSVGNNEWTNQRYYYFPSSGSDLVYYGQALYSSQTEALNAISTESFFETENTQTGAIFVGYITTKGNATDLSNTGQARFTQAGLFRSSGAAGGSSSPSSGTVDAARTITVRAIKNTAGTINKGQAVYITSYDNSLGVIEVELAQSDNASTMPAFGIANGTITDAAIGEVVEFGQVLNIDTSSFSEADELFVSDSVAGGFVNTAPQGTNLIQKIATVTESNAATGKIQVFGSGQTNALPNLPNGNIWVGDVNGVPQAESKPIQVSMLADGTDGQLITWDAAGVATTVGAGTAGQVLTSNGAGAEPTFQAGGSGSGEALVREVTETAHGLTVDTLYPMYWDGTNYVVSDSSSAATSECTWIGNPTGVNTINLYADGSYISGFTAITADAQYYVASGGGAITTTVPSDGEISKPVFKTVSTTAGQVEIYRGIEVGGGESGNVVFSQTLNNQATCDIDNLPTNYDYFEIDLINLVPVVGGSDFAVRTSSDGGATYDSGASDYSWIVTGNYVAGATTVTSLDQGDLASDRIKLNGARTISNTAGEGINGTLRLSNPSAAEITNLKGSFGFTGTASGETAQANMDGQRRSAADVDALQIYIDGGASNISSGQVIVRGFNNTSQSTAGTKTSYYSGKSSGSISTVTATYIGLGNSASNTAEASVDMIMPFAGTIRNLYVQAETAPSAANSFVYTVRINRADSAVTCTISNTDTTANDVSNTATFAAGDTVCVEVDGTAGSASSIHSVSFEVQAD